jgi:hypothetical protein
MSSASSKSEYLLIFRGTDCLATLSAEEIKKVMVEWVAWSERLIAEGRVKANRALGRTGKIVSGKERNITDGPFAEAKEAVAGYFLVEVADLDEALAIAGECPTLSCGATVEVRPMPKDCPAHQLAAASVEEIAGLFGQQSASKPGAAMAVSALQNL